MRASGDFMGKTASLNVIRLLAFAQAVAGLLRAFNWVQIGVNLFSQGILLLPFIGVVAVIHGLLISIVALLYVLFVIATFLESRWARWVGLVGAILNLLLVLSALIQGAPLAEVIAWSLIPSLLLFYLFSSMGRRALEYA